MKMGIVFFSLVKRFQGRTRQKNKPKSFLLCSSNEELVNKLSLIFQKKVIFHDLKTEKMVISSLLESSSGTEIILDNQFISFKESISILESLKNSGFTFKIKPKNANFLIGSDNNNERGEIIKVE